jgi:quercetin dioxygenase-like cupin family protein
MIKRLLLAASVLPIVAAVVAAAALATGSTGTINRETLAQSAMSESWNVNTDRIKFFNKDEVKLLVQKVTYAPGADSGWHLHPGVVLVTVANPPALTGAQVTRYVGCSSHTYSAGQSFIENGEQEPGKIANTGSVDAVLYATFIVPADAPFSDASPPAPSC